jgi:hypothetical protein
MVSTGTLLSRSGYRYLLICPVEVIRIFPIHAHPRQGSTAATQRILVNCGEDVLQLLLSAYCFVPLHSSLLFITQPKALVSSGGFVWLL